MSKFSGFPGLLTREQRDLFRSKAKNADLVKRFASNGDFRRGPLEKKFNSGETRANQELAQYQSIDFILKSFTTTGRLPTTDVQYMDISNIPTNVTDMMAQLDAVYDVFSQLPSDIRAQMNNDIRNYPGYVASAAGQAALIDAGFLPKPKEPEAPKAIEGEPIPASAKNSQSKAPKAPSEASE